MTTFSRPLTLASDSGDSITLDAIVDTGAAFTTVPAHILEGLGVQAHRTARLRLADGGVVEWRLGWVRVILDGMDEMTLCVFGSASTPPLIGAHTLEQFLLGVDPVTERLVPRDAWLLHIDVRRGNG